MNDQISSAGLELANVLVTSPLLHQSWNAVLDQKQKLPSAADPNQKMALDISETKHSNITIISFLASPVTLQDRQVIISLTPKDTYFPLFEYLCNKNTPSFSVNELAITLFALNHNRLVRLRTRSLQQQQPNIEFEGLTKKMVTHERKLVSQKTKVYSSFLNLNEAKKYMANMEWYKKESKDMGIGYYDRYRNKRYASDIIAQAYKDSISNFWVSMVPEIESKSQKEQAAMRIHFLSAGTNYRRMFEPLHIAEYYKEGGKDYKKERPRHFVLLEQWFNEEEKKEEEKKEREEREDPQLRSASKSNSKAKRVASSLNDDSCFWAHIEEALIWCDEQAINPDANSMPEFELYVLNALQNFAVSPDIFLPQSSFMRWWNKYKEIVGSSYSSELTDVMRCRTYRKYADGVSVLDGL